MVDILNSLGFGYLEDYCGYLKQFRVSGYLKMIVDILSCLGAGYHEDDGGYLKLFRAWIS